MGERADNEYCSKGMKYAREYEGKDWFDEECHQGVTDRAKLRTDMITKETVATKTSIKNKKTS